MKHTRNFVQRIKASWCWWTHGLHHDVDDATPGPTQWWCNKCGRKWIEGHSDMTEMEWLKLSPREREKLLDQ